MRLRERRGSEEKRGGKGRRERESNTTVSKMQLYMTHCPPSGRSSPMILSCGFNRAVYTAKLAGEPEREQENNNSDTTGIRNRVQEYIIGIQE